MIFAKKTVRPMIESNFKINIGNENISLVQSAKNLGLVIDQDLRFREQVSQNVKRAYASLRLLYLHKSYMTIATKKNYVKVWFCRSSIIAHRYMDLV